MGNNRQSISSEQTLNRLTSSAIEWVTHITDFIEQDMGQDEIDYVNNHLENISNFAPNGIYLSENSNRTFLNQNLKEGDIFSFDNGLFKAFTKEGDVANQFSKDTMALGGNSTIFHINQGNAFDISKLSIKDVLANQQFRVDKITKSTLNEMGYNKKIPFLRNYGKELKIMKLIW